MLAKHIFPFQGQPASIKGKVVYFSAVGGFSGQAVFTVFFYVFSFPHKTPTP